MNGVSMTEAGRLLGCNRTSIRKRLREHGYPESVGRANGHPLYRFEDIERIVRKNPIGFYRERNIPIDEPHSLSRNANWVNQQAVNLVQRFGPELEGVPEPDELAGRGNCSGKVDLFYPTRGEKGNAAKKLKTAKKLCDTCPIQPDCLAYAIANGERYGVWGGGLATDRGRVVRAMNELRQRRGAA